MTEERPVEWMGSTRKDLRGFPDDVKDVMGYALYLAQTGRKHPDASPMSGALRGVMEVVDDEDGDTYRVMYTLKLENVVYILHAFQKKSTRGIKTPQRELEVIKQRLRDARAHHRKHYGATKAR